MNIEFHYWVTGMVARSAGFTEREATIIAHASQYVDDNVQDIEVKSSPGGEKYRSQPSQMVDPLHPKGRLLHLLACFHFVPGDPTAKSARRGDGKMHILNTTPGGSTATTMLDDAFHAGPETRLYAIGIASHAYSDTWAHQNFVGWIDSFNRRTVLVKLPTSRARRLGSRLLNLLIRVFTGHCYVGHVQFDRDPDLVGLEWHDPRLTDPGVCNNERFLDAAKRLRERYRHWLRMDGREPVSSWEELEVPITRGLSGPPDGDPEERCRQRWQPLAPWLPEYRKDVWRHEAVLSRRWFLSPFVVRHTWKEEKEKTRWYWFQEAAKEHLLLGVWALEPLRDSMGLDWFGEREPA